MSVARFRVMEHAPPEPAVRALPIDWLVMGFAALVCLGLWTTSTRVLLASGLREDGHVLACRYFTGASMVERQYQYTAGDAAQHACPPIRRGG